MTIYRFTETETGNVTDFATFTDALAFVRSLGMDWHGTSVNDGTREWGKGREI